MSSKLSKKNKAGVSHNCPCGLGPSYEACCGRYVEHFETTAAPDAQALMRSRYSAFVRADAAYLQATWAPAHRPQTLDFDDATQWLGLEVRSHRSTGEHSAEVEFVARYRIGGRAVRLHENSRFERLNGRWYYLDGDQH